MLQQIHLNMLPCKERVKPVINAINSNTKLSYKPAAAVYKVPKATLRRRRAKLASKRVLYSNPCKLARQEEEIIICLRLEISTIAQGRRCG